VSSGEGERYHHGDLRRALLDATLELIESRGLAELSLRAVARAAGVSHAAPYHHFADRRALLAAVAEEGFRALRGAMLARAERVEGPALRLQEAGIGYVLFALTHPAHFRVMFSPELAERGDYAELRDAAQGSQAVLLSAIERCQAAGVIGAGDTDLLGLAAWAQVHGLATLLLDGYLGQGAAGAERGGDLDAAEALAREVTEVLWTGLRG
jgi:AcrR family transcriptional regulator